MNHLKCCYCSSRSHNRQFSDQEDHCVAELRDKTQLPSIHPSIHLSGAYPTFRRLNDHNQQLGLNSEELYMRHHETGSQKTLSFGCGEVGYCAKKDDKDCISVYLQGPTSLLWSLFKPQLWPFSPAHIAKSQLRIKIDHRHQYQRSRHSPQSSHTHAPP